jgi:hypothetical protein
MTWLFATTFSSKLGLCPADGAAKSDQSQTCYFCRLLFCLSSTNPRSRGADGATTALGLRARASRAIQHADIKEICKAFQGPTAPARLKALLPHPLSPQLRAISKTFVDLQEERHAADYDVSLKLSQSAVLSSVANAENVFSQWAVIRNSDEANVFLAALVFGKRWDR